MNTKNLNIITRRDIVKSVADIVLSKEVHAISFCIKQDDDFARLNDIRKYVQTGLEHMLLEWNPKLSDIPVASAIGYTWPVVFLEKSLYFGLTYKNTDRAVLHPLTLNSFQSKVYDCWKTEYALLLWKIEMSRGQQ